MIFYLLNELFNMFRLYLAPSEIGTSNFTSAYQLVDFSVSSLRIVNISELPRCVSFISVRDYEVHTPMLKALTLF